MYSTKILKGRGVSFSIERKRRNRLPSRASIVYTDRLLLLLLLRFSCCHNPDEKGQNKTWRDSGTDRRSEQQQARAHTETDAHTNPTRGRGLRLRSWHTDNSNDTENNLKKKKSLFFLSIDDGKMAREKQQDNKCKREREREKTARTCKPSGMDSRCCCGNQQLNRVATSLTSFVGNLFRGTNKEDSTRPTGRPRPVSHFFFFLFLYLTIQLSRRRWRTSHRSVLGRSWALLFTFMIDYIFNSSRTQYLLLLLSSSDSWLSR